MLSFRFRRWMQAGVVCLLAVVMLGADPSSRFNKVGHEMICTCGCGQVLLGVQSRWVPCFASDDWRTARADGWWWIGHFDPKLVCG